MRYHKEELGKNIHAARTAKGLSQEQLGKLIYKTGKQISNYENNKALPTLDSLLDLCDVLDCELGFLLGEKDYSEGARLETAIIDSTGLTSESLKNLRYITCGNKSRPRIAYTWQDNRRVLNRFLSDSFFMDFFSALFDLDLAISKNQLIRDEPEKNMGKERYERALKYIISDADYRDTEMTEEQLQDIRSIANSIDGQDDMSFRIKVCRYTLNETFVKFINKLYPQKY